MFEVKSHVQVLDYGVWRAGTITAIENFKNYKIHFDNFASKHDGFYKIGKLL